MKIVLDTNVFISGIFFSGPPSQILKSWRKSEIRIILTEEIIEEYQRVGEELSAKYPSITIESIIELFTFFGEFVETKSISESICEDPDDHLMAEALKLSNIKTKKGVVETALKLFVQVKRQEKIRKLRGKLHWEGNLSEMRLD